MEYLKSLVSNHGLLSSQGREIIMQDFFDFIDKNKDNSIDRSELYEVVSDFANTHGLNYSSWALPEINSIGQGIYYYILFLLTIHCTLALIETIRAYLGLRPTYNKKWPEKYDYTNKRPAGVEKATIEEALVYDTPLPKSKFAYENVKTFMFQVSGLAYLRLLLFVLTFLAGCLCAQIACFAKRDSYWDRFWFGMSGFCSSWIPFWMAFSCIPVRGQLEREKAKILVANHTCLCEVVMLFGITGGCSFVSRKENRDIPGFNAILEAGDCVTIDRLSPEGRKKGLQEINERAMDKNPRSKQLMIFPEGTMDNANVLFRFSKGAFVTGSPVQPVLFRFDYEHFNPCWTGKACGGNDVKDVFLRMCCQFVNRCDVDILPVYYANKSEQEGESAAETYATNIQYQMCHGLGWKVSDATYFNYVEREKQVAAAKLEKYTTGKDSAITPSKRESDDQTRKDQ